LQASIQLGEKEKRRVQQLSGKAGRGNWEKERKWFTIQLTKYGKTTDLAKVKSIGLTHLVLSDLNKLYTEKKGFKLSIKEKEGL
jgi:hypothetical protein